MSYKVFALKWRPQAFDEIVGQNHIVFTIKNALAKNRLGHAYLFAGPRGVGKTSTARILAKALNCKDGPTVTPCQKCNSCLEITQGRSLDVIEIDGASNRGIDEIRALRESVKFAPVGGKYKIYIIDEVHQITTDAFNALLKTLEEPPAFIKFIFATTHPHKIIPTILSRCQRFDFRRIPVMEIIEQLERIVKQESINIDKEVLFTIAKTSDGSLRDAESLLDQLFSFSQEKISLPDVISILGIVDQETIFELTDKIIEKDAKAALRLLDEIIDKGKDAGVFLTNLIEHFRNLMIAKVAQADSKLIDLPQDICVRLLQQAQRFSLEEILSAFNVLVRTQEMSKRLDSLRIPLEVSLVKLAYDKENPGQGGAFSPQQAKPIKQQQELQTKQDCAGQEKNAICENNAPAPEKEPPQPGASPLNQSKVISLEEIKGAWQNVIDTLGKIKISVATYLNEADLIKAENNVLTLSFPKNYSLHKESLERKDNKAIIEKALTELFDVNIRINLVLSKEVVHKEESENNPFVKSVLDAFKAKIVF